MRNRIIIIIIIVTILTLSHVSCWEYRFSFSVPYFFFFWLFFSLFFREKIQHFYSYLYVLLLFLFFFYFAVLPNFDYWFSQDSFSRLNCMHKNRNESPNVFFNPDCIAVITFSKNYYPLIFQFEFPHFFNSILFFFIDCFFSRLDLNELIFFFVCMRYVSNSQNSKIYIFWPFIFFNFFFFNFKRHFKRGNLFFKTTKVPNIIILAILI